eukprot:NODE_396_length_2115_cov_70.281220_g317_i0.p1 GENE.NODE_396_length_2115_cov_70.281220_g317_i0~~NODE_396_length_2115_cov_70.281220_g317_i0.p1  ORF type:complete len:626 (+),score=176.33 NODE_396_length_2115_cov_70.281220_g317_i0:146-2023(+)
MAPMLLFAGLLALAAAPAAAVLKTYTGADRAATAEWYVDKNWEPHGIPAITDDVLVDFSNWKRGTGAPQLFIQAHQNHSSLVQCATLNITGGAGGSVLFNTNFTSTVTNVLSSGPSVLLQSGEKTLNFGTLNLVQTNGESFQYTSGILTGQINVHAGSALHFAQAGIIQIGAKITNLGAIIIDETSKGYRPLSLTADIDNDKGSVTFTGQVTIQGTGLIVGGSWVVGPAAAVQVQTSGHTPKEMHIQGNVTFESCSPAAPMNVGKVMLPPDSAVFSCSCPNMIVQSFSGSGTVSSASNCGLTITDACSITNLESIQRGQSITFQNDTNVQTLNLLAPTKIVADGTSQLSVYTVILRGQVTWDGTILVDELNMEGDATWTISDGAQFYVRSKWIESSTTGVNLEMQGNSDLYLNGTVLVNRPITIFGSGKDSSSATIHNDGRIIIDLGGNAGNHTDVSLTHLTLRGSGYIEIRNGTMTFAGEARVNQTAVQLQNNHSRFRGESTTLSLEDIVANDDSQHIRLNISEMTMQCHRTCGKVVGTASFDFQCIEKPYNDQLPPAFQSPVTKDDGKSGGGSGGGGNHWLGWVVGGVIGLVVGAVLTAGVLFALNQTVLSRRSGYEDIQGKT